MAIHTKLLGSRKCPEMGRFETVILPKALLHAQAKRNDFEREKLNIGMKLDGDEEFADHDCDCDRCDSQNYEPLSRLAREELEADFDELDLAIGNLDVEIKRMINYKTWVESL